METHQLLSTFVLHVILQYQHPVLQLEVMIAYFGSQWIFMLGNVRTERLFFLQELKDAVKRCLGHFQECSCPSISFPINWSPKLPVDTVADTMIEAVLNFARAYPKKKREVQFVICPGDRAAYEVSNLLLTTHKTENSKSISIDD